MAPLLEKRFLKIHQTDTGKKEYLTALIQTRLLQNPEILFAYLHGSFVEEGPFRDIDVGIYVEGEKPVFFEFDLSHDLTSITDIETDVRLLNTAPIAFQMSVIRDGRLLFSRNEELQTDFIERTSKRFPEYAHFRNLFLEMDGAKRR